MHTTNISTAVTFSSNKVLLDYSANINSLGLHSGVKKKNGSSLYRRASLLRLPDSQCRDLVKALLTTWGDQDWILCGDGAWIWIFIGFAF